MKFNKWFYISIILLAFYFLYRLIDMSQMISVFPIDTYANDRSGHIAKLFFLDKYGLHNNVPNWYNGNYQILKLYPPGWYILSALPLLYLFKSPQAAVYYSIILTYLLGFLAFWFLGSVINLKMIDRIAMFLLFFANPLTIGYLLRLGKDPEMFAWVFVISIFALLLYYRNKILDFKFYAIFILLSIFLFYIHILVFIMAFFIMLSFFITRGVKDKIRLIFAGIVILVLTSFFWYPFLTSLSGGIQIEKTPLKNLLSDTSATTNDKIVAYVIPIIFFILAWFYLASNNIGSSGPFKLSNYFNKELLFFLVPIAVAVLILIRVLAYVPFFNKVFSDTYSIFFILVSLFFLFNINLQNLNPHIKFIFNISIIITPLIAIFISHLFTPYFVPHSNEIKSVLDLLPNVDGSLFTLWGSTVNGHAIYSYGAIYYDIRTPEGWDPTNLSKKDHDTFYRLYGSAKSRDCITFRNDMNALKIENFIVPKEFCEPPICGLKVKKRNELSCLLVK